ncbi:MAG TPA: leucine--tRNA ligase [Solirubrobacterales bacterium]|nr:leucine--tRNA ligase [Solirubrobacterales bacterium]
MAKSVEPATDLPPYRYTAELANSIEEKWIERWEERRTYFTPNPVGEISEPNGELAKRPPYYVLDMFPYPSGSGLHVGHPLGYIGSDIYARYKRMDGFNVLHAMGYDAFGLPAERYAVDSGRHPDVTTRQNIANMRAQLRRIGLGHDPRRGVSTIDPEYYRWTQWIFLQIFDSWYDADRQRARPIAELVEELDAGARPWPPGSAANGRSWSALSERERRRAIDSARLAYLAEVTVNWCPALGTVLANEEVTADGRSEQGNFPVFRRPLRQWMMRITAYADRLADDLEGLEWPESLKLMQRNWIGRSFGVQLDFSVKADTEVAMPVFTTRPDTLFGVTFLAVAPEHPLLAGGLPASWTDDIPASWRGEASVPDAPDGGFASPAEAVAAYKHLTERRSDRQREGDEGPSGVFTGLWAEHPLSKEKVPVFVADYVLMQYGSGAVMGVPAHDSRDFAFARALGVPVEMVVQPPVEWLSEQGLASDAGVERWSDAYTGQGTSVGSGRDTDGLPSEEAGRAFADQLERLGLGEHQISYRLRDWLFSRQRYWGEPFPIVYDEEGDPVALPESELPVLLPELSDFSPKVSDDELAEPEPPLARLSDWVETELDLGEGKQRYRRETNTMPQWAGSCWYYLRYLDPTNSDAMVDPEVERYWMKHQGEPGGVNLYVGGVEHAVLHLLYARFWHKVLHDLGHVSSPEPFQRLFNQGYVQAAAYTDERGFYVEASEVEERDGSCFHRGQPVERSYGKMGKSLKNGISPDEIIAGYGADALRLYEMFLGPLDQDRPWETQGIAGVVRFLQRVWRYVVDEQTGEARVVDAPPPVGLRRALHRTIASVRRDIESLRLNTAIASLMEFSNELRAELGDEPPAREIAEALVRALAPFAPHLCEELWERLGHTDSVVYAPYPESDPDLAALDQVKIAVQVNGKLRAVLEVPAGAERDELEAAARAEEKVAELLAGAKLSKTIVVPGRIVNFVLDGKG